MTNDERTIISLLLQDFESRFNNRIECLPKYYDRTKSIDNRLQNVERRIKIIEESRQDYDCLLNTLCVLFGIIILSIIAIVYLLLR